MLSHPFIRLMRLNQPTGIWLLLWPCWWALTFADENLPSPKMLLLFLGGAIVMRSAGCVFNDIIDRKIDAGVERTRNRPLASGEVTLTEALVLLVLLLFIALDIAIQMKPAVLRLAAVSLAFVAAYPFMKRITWWPQLFLGLTFNLGALMGWLAQTGTLPLAAWLLYAGGIAWTLGYDTIYAHQDTEDDRKIGVKSTALLLGPKSRKAIAVFYAVAVILWAFAGTAHHSGGIYYAGLAGVAAHFAWQARTVTFDSPSSCLRVFKSNAAMGWIMFAGIWGDSLRFILAHL